MPPKYAFAWVWSIVAATVGFRLLMFPLIVKAQANAARLNNIKPQLEEIQSQLRELMNTNDAVGKATATFKMKQLYKDNNCHPVKVRIKMKIYVKSYKISSWCKNVIKVNVLRQIT